jgi:hypothetical protein
MATKKPMKKFKRYDEGGSVEEAMAKQRGLDISNKEAPVGFFERIRAGNIDQPGTEAYNRFGAGRGRDRGESVSVNQPMSAPSMPAASSRPLSDDMYSDYGSSTGMGAAGTSETVKPTRPMATKPVVPAKPVAPNKQSTGFYMPPESRDKPNYSNEGRGRPAPAGFSAASQIPGQSAKAPQGEKINSSETSRNIENAMLAAGAGGVGLAGLYKMFKGGKKAASAARDLVTSPKAKSFMGKADDEKAASAYDKMKKSSFVKKGGDDVTDVTPKSKSTTMKQLGKPSLKKALDESDTTGGAIGYKRGGKTKNYASGGMVSSASRRADGIATKGKTRCKIC